MDAYLSVGDIARINYHEYKIIGVKPNEIVIINPNNKASSIIYDTILNKWQVQNYLPDHNIAFIKQQTPIPTIIDFTLTGVADADMHILLESDYNTIYGICEHNLLPICDREWFWQQKVERDFGHFAMKYNTENTYREQYEQLISAMLNLNMNRIEDPQINMDYLFDNFTLDVLLYLEHINKLSTYQMRRLANFALYREGYKLLEYFISKNIWPTTDGIVDAGRAGKTEMLDWLVSKDIDVYKHVKSYLNIHAYISQSMHPKLQAWLDKNKPRAGDYEY